MPKRSRPRTSDDVNPLSSARKDFGGSSKHNNDQHTSNLWHRKSGAGYKLFISYYGAQPLGVVVVDDDNGRDGNDDVGSSSMSIHGNSSVSGGGMSRAAKKRRKKQSKKSNASYDVPVSCNNNAQKQKQQQQQQHKPQKFNESHPLIQTFNSVPKIYSQHQHLTQFIHAVSRPLPLTLRFRQNNKEEERQQSLTTNEFKHQLSTHHSAHITPVSYDPTNSIYQSTPNSTLCKSNLKKLSPQLKQLIVEGSMNGTLARQELGSMLPVISLHAVGAIQGGSKVLDLCASPGSKTLQTLEIVCGNNDNNSSNKKKGRIIANDVHLKRLDSLRDAVIRSGMPASQTSRITYTNYDASIFPLPKSGKLFDAIICDVPCGGDGTIRKDKFILPMWSPNISNNIHGLQMKILLRALELVKVDGVVCYSTCSLNPVEDEAVVSAVLNCSRGNNNDAAFELMEWPDVLPGFIRRPGVTNWKVAYYDQNNDDETDDDDFGSLSFVDSYENAVSIGMKDAKTTYWSDLAENKRIRLDRCTRLLPQDQDSGGFFLALIQRIR